MLIIKFWEGMVILGRERKEVISSCLVGGKPLAVTVFTALVKVKLDGRECVNKDRHGG